MLCGCNFVILNMKRYNLLTGIIISLFLAGIGIFPRLLRLEEMWAIAGHVAYSVVNSMWCWIQHHYFFRKYFHQRHSEKFWWKSIIGVIIGAFVGTVFFLLIYPAGVLETPFTIPFPEYSIQFLIMVAFRCFLISGFLFFIVFNSFLVTESQRAGIENERLKRDNLQAKLDSLRQQISPHFLFNALNTLSSLTADGNVKDYVAELANVYRYLLRVRQSDLVTVAEELDFIESYLYILKERFEEAITLDIQIPPQIRQSKLPPLALQMLVENAVKHNVISSAKPLHVIITGEPDGVQVYNNRRPKQSQEPPSGHGLPNIRERYQLLANKQIVINQGENFFSVKLPILQ